MAKSKLLKEAIADAKTVKETAIANAKIALEEAFTPRLQSILSKKLQAEMEGDDYEDDELEELDSSDIGDGTGETPVDPSADASDAHTDLGSDTDEEDDEVGEEDENVDVVSEEEHDDEMHEEEEEEMHEEDEFEDEDDLDLEEIIAELESELEDEGEYEEGYNEGEYEEDYHEGDYGDDEVEENAGVGYDDPTNADDAEIDLEELFREMEEEDDDHMEEGDDEDVVDLEEILREMGYGDDDEMEEDYMEEMEDDDSELEAELEEAYSTIKSLQSTINEVNLLNAKLLYANKLFRGYSLTNEQKAKIVENLDRTSSVREVKLVYATLAESINFKGAERKTRRISESISKPSKSTAPKKEVITESSDVLAERFKKLAGIVKG